MLAILTHECQQLNQAYVFHVRALKTVTHPRDKQKNKHPDDGDSSDPNLLLINCNMSLNILINTHLLVCDVSGNKIGILRPSHLTALYVTSGNGQLLAHGCCRIEMQPIKLTVSDNNTELLNCS